MRPGVQDGALDGGAGGDGGAFEEDGAAHQGTLVDHDPWAEDGALDAAGDAAARRDQALGDARRPLDAGGQALGAVGEDRRTRVVEHQGGRGREQVHVRLPVALQGADVAPVAVEPELAHPPLLDQPRQQLVAEVGERGLIILTLPAVLAIFTTLRRAVPAGALGGEAVERVEQGGRVVEEDLGGDQVAPRRLGLVLEAGDPAVAAGLDHPEAAGLLARHPR